ncbi:MAG TPA: AarF/UbiB family protein [Pyrinomonadaceae bacterium]|nr:AarF/UbiB family protein [Pyrinomonadaceae bacterium]
MREHSPERASRPLLRSRRKEVEQRLADFGLARGPRRALRVAGADAAEPTHSRRLRAALESLGPVFASFGLYLSTRVDLLDARDCLELAAIADRGEAEPPCAARALCERELGGPPAEVFLDFEERPFESRLLFQLHRARLGEGQDITVKLVRPGAAKYLACDAALLSLMGEGRAAPECSEQAFAAALSDFRRMLRRQTDLTHEARALELLAHDAGDCGMLRAPVVHGSHCTASVLTVERLPGASPADAFTPHEMKGEPAAAAGWPGHDYDRANLARRLCVVWLRQALLGNFFPVEPLPGNVMIMPDRQIAFTGGVFARLPAESKADLWAYLLAAAADNPDRACECLLRVLKNAGGPHENKVRQRFRQAVPFRNSGWSLSEDGNSLAEHLFVHWKLAGEHGYLPPPHLAPFYRGLFMIARLAHQLDPGHDALADGLQDVRLVAGVERLRAFANPDVLGERAERYAAMMMDLPQRLDEALTLVSEGRAGVKPQAPEAAGRKNSPTTFTALLMLLVAFVLLSQHFDKSLAGAEGVKVAVFLALGGLLLRAASRA